MKASEALSLGRTITDNPKAHDINSCAVGMILNACGVPQYRPDFWLTQPNLNRVQEVIDRYPWLVDQLPESFPYHLPLQACKSKLLEGTYYNWVITAFNNLVMAGTMTLDQLHDIIAEVEPACGICNEFDCSCHEVDTAVQSLVQERSGHVEEAFKNMEMAK